jgi:hypothetical protein
MQTLPIDTTKVRVRALSEPLPHNEFGTNTQKVTPDGEVVYKVRVIVSTDTGSGEVIWVKVPGLPEGIEPDSLCAVEGLRLLPWANNGSSGVAYWCDSIEALGATS